MALVGVSSIGMRTSVWIATVQKRQDCSDGWYQVPARWAGSRGLVYDRDLTRFPRQLKLWKVVDRRDLIAWKPIPFELIKPVYKQGEGTSETLRATVKLDSGVHEIQFESEAKLLLELRTIADWVIRPLCSNTTGRSKTLNKL
jgi:hypothetical protein